MQFLRIETSEGVRRVGLGDEPIVIGRGQAVAVCLDEPKASREHVLVTPLSNGIIIRDLGSRNGTWLGSTRIEQARIGPGESFRIGDSVVLLVAEAASSRRRPGLTKPVLGAILPALILLILVELAASAIGASRASEVGAAQRRLEAAVYGMARLPAERSPRDPEVELKALEDFLAAWPDSRYAVDAREEIRRIKPNVTRIRGAREDLAVLTELRKAGTLPFAELYFRYQKLLEQTSDLPTVAADIRAAFLALDSSHREKLKDLVVSVIANSTTLADQGEYGRAASLLAAFSRRHPSAATNWEEDLGRAEALVNEKSLHAYRDLLTRADELRRGDKNDEGVELLRKEAVRFTGTRFRTLLLARADTLAGRAVGGGAAGTADRVAEEAARRRSYDLMAAEAQELASAGFFLRAADKLAAILPAVAIPAVKIEFAESEKELRGLHALIEEVKQTVRTRGEAFGSVRIGDTPFKVLGMEGDTIRLRFRKSEISRVWGAFTPNEELAILRAAKLPPQKRLMLAIFCFHLSLRTDYEVEIIEGLSHDATRETAGRLYARKEGRPYPEGGFIPYRGRILTREEHAEEIHKEKIAGLRSEQLEQYGKLIEHPGFQKLEKLRGLRTDLDKARQYALALIFDEVKYFYPYRDRMGEYQPVQDEVDERVKAVREIWDNPAQTTVQADRKMKSILEKIDEVNAELARLGIDNREFEKNIAALTIYLDRTLTVRTYFRRAAEEELFAYDRRMMEWNEKSETAATEMERKQVRLTNEYRLMMGRRALAIDDRLVKSARGHSEEMQRLGYFSHTSPIPERRSVEQRVKLEGYFEPIKPSAISENIHRGSGDPEGAHWGWTHSSGHHRNLLARYWTEMGTGHVGKHWTQNFGRTKPKKFASSKDENK